MIATTLMTMVLVTVSVVMRTGRLAWEAHEADSTRLTAAHATLRHMVRQVRQAEEVVTVSSPQDTSGALSVKMPGGETYVWDHDAVSNTVRFGIDSASDLLADHIVQLNLQGFRADGVTPAVTVDELQCLRITVATELPRDTNPLRTVSSWVWIRSW
jgi:hypothetical protein